MNIPTPNKDSVTRLLGALGLCARAGALIYGTDRVCEALRRKEKGKTPLFVIQAEGTSSNTNKKLSDKCSYYKVKHTVIPVDSATLASALGKTGLLAAVGITNSELCRAVQKQLDALNAEQD